jgi:hypothetical protein
MAAGENVKNVEKITLVCPVQNLFCAKPLEKMYED